MHILGIEVSELLTKAWKALPVSIRPYSILLLTLLVLQFCTLSAFHIAIHLPLLDLLNSSRFVATEAGIVALSSLFCAFLAIVKPRLWRNLEDVEAHYPLRSDRAALASFFERVMKRARLIDLILTF